MKKIILIIFSSLLFSSVATEIKNNNMSQAHTKKMEKRLAKLEVLLKIKAQERENKSTLRDLKLQKLDASLKEKAKKRENTDSGYNSVEIHKVLKKN